MSECASLSLLFCLDNTIQNHYIFIDHLGENGFLELYCVAGFLFIYFFIVPIKYVLYPQSRASDNDALIAPLESVLNVSGSTVKLAIMNMQHPVRLSK